MIDYSWVPWFKELVDLIAEHDERWLVERAKAVDWGKENAPVIPTPPAAAQALYHDGESFGPDRCWRLFRQAAKTVPAIHSHDFDDELNMPNVAIKKLTHTLFIVNPSHFFPADLTGTVLAAPIHEGRL